MLSKSNLLQQYIKNNIFYECTLKCNDVGLFGKLLPDTTKIEICCESLDCQIFLRSYNLFAIY